MRIGLAVRLYGFPGSIRPAPTWARIKEQVLAAEHVGFDLAVVEDALSFPSKDKVAGLWESVSVMGAMAEATSTLDLSHSVLNAPYRSPAMVAKIAETLDEISGGRYTLGIGAGNTPEADYAAFGFPADHRYSRFAEAIAIIHGLLKHGEVDFDGAFHSARGAQMVLRGPRPEGPPITIAAGGPKMLRLAARFGDEWNWWAEPGAGADDLRPQVDDLDRACEEVGRDPATLGRSLDIYFPVVPQGQAAASGGGAEPSDEETAEALLSYRQLGVGEVRCYLPASHTHEAAIDAITGMARVVELVRADGSAAGLP